MEEGRHFILLLCLLTVTVLECGGVVPKDFCTKKKDGDYPYPPDCTKFISCSAGQPHEMPCPAGLWFDRNKLRCNFPHNITNPNCTAPKHAFSSPVIISVCSGKKLGSQPHPMICSKFIVCNGKGDGVLKTCNPHSNFDPDYRVCVWETIYSCKGLNFCKGKKDGDYEDPSKCDEFIKCVGGLTYHQPCPKGLWYNVKINQCDYPKNVDCKALKTTAAPTTTTTITTTTTPTTTTTTTPTTTTTTTPTTTTTTTTTKAARTTPPKNFCAGKKHGNYPDPTRCDGYIACTGNTIYYMPCPAGLWYNPKIDQCDWPSNVDCKALTSAQPATRQTTSATQTTAKPPSSYCKDKPSGLYPDPDRCDWYIVCSPAGTYHMKCPSSLWFDPSAKTCQRPENVACHAKTTAKPTDQSPFACNGRVGEYPNPSSCSSFIVCLQDGNAVVKYCPAKLHFHPKYRVCVWAYNYPCVNGKPTGHLCEGRKDGNYRDPDRCDGYIACSGGLRYPMDCPKGLWYNAVTDKCDYPKNVQCVQKSTAKPPHTTKANPSTGGTPPANFCKGKTSGNYADPSRCDGYLACSIGKIVYRMDCPAGLWYDATTDKCDYKQNVHCVVPTTAPKPVFSCVGKTPGPYPASENCNKFHVCNGNDDSGSLKVCPKHTNFYPRLGVCVWSYSYSCEDPSFCIGRIDGSYKNPNNCYGYYQCSAGMTFPRNCDSGLRFNGNACVDASKYICS